jgi:hypothetical protein
VRRAFALVFAMITATLAPLPAAARVAPGVIMRVVRAETHRFQGCYDLARQRDPSIKGRISVRFLIGKTGAVHSAFAHESSTITDVGMRMCVARVFLGMVFPANERGVLTIVYPLEFVPPEG